VTPAAKRWFSIRSLGHAALGSIPSFGKIFSSPKFCLIGFGSVSGRFRIGVRWSIHRILSLWGTRVELKRLLMTQPRRENTQLNRLGLVSNGHPFGPGFRLGPKGRPFKTLRGAFSLHRASGPPRAGRSRRTSYPQKWSEKASSGPPRTLSRTSDRLSPRDKMSITSDSSTNQMVFHGVPSNVHSFPVPYQDHWKGKLFDFATIFTQLTEQGCTGRRGNL